MHALCMIMQIYDAQKLVDNVCTHTNVHALMYIFYTCILMSAYTYTCTHTHMNQNNVTQRFERCKLLFYDQFAGQC